MHNLLRKVTQTHTKNISSILNSYHRIKPMTLDIEVYVNKTLDYKYKSMIKHWAINTYHLLLQGVVLKRLQHKKQKTLSQTNLYKVCCNAAKSLVNNIKGTYQNNLNKNSEDRPI